MIQYNVFLIHQHNSQNYESTVKNPVCDSSEKSKMTNIFKTHIRDYYVQRGEREFRK